MTRTSETVVFFGSGPVAAESLALLAQWASIEAVVTKPKPAHHKGSFPVLETAERLGLQVLPVTDKRSLDTLFASRPVKSRVGVLVDFGIIVSQAVIDYFPLGIINSHFSILPEWRGADPISFAILSGQDMTGVSTMLLVAGLDEGPLLGYGEQPLDGTETTPELTQKLILLSDALLQHDVPRHLAEQTNGVPQTITGREVSYSRKLTKADGTLNFAKPARQLEREVRAYAEWPKSRTTIGKLPVVINKARVLSGEGQPGSLYRSGKELGFYTSDGIFIIDTLTPAGKKPMSAASFLAGYGQQL